MGAQGIKCMKGEEWSGGVGEGQKRNSVQRREARPPGGQFPLHTQPTTPGPLSFRKGAGRFPELI